MPAMYADDTNITTNGDTIEELEDKLNSELNNVHNWPIANKLILNVSKTEYMVVGTRQRLTRNRYDPKIQIGEKDIKRVSITKSMGILVDELASTYRQRQQKSFEGDWYVKTCEAISLTAVFTYNIPLSYFTSF